MVTIDGSHGEGGGQIIRSSLALSLVTGRPVTIENVRGGRRKPGLLRQHLTALRAAAEISDGEIEGAELGSRRVSLSPGAVRSGEYRFSVGSAGSAMLVLQTLLPALMLAEGPSTLTIEGGTHNPYAPPFDFLVKTYFPLLRRMGVQVGGELDRYGFFPAGGGCARFTIQPTAELQRITLLERGEDVGQRVRAVVSQLPLHIGERECKTVARKMNWSDKCCAVEQVSDPRGPGNVLLVELEAENVTELFTAFGEVGVRAEQVAGNVVRQVRKFLKSEAPVGEHLADQLLLPMGIGAHQGSGGGAFRTGELSPHATTHIEVIREFLDVTIDVEREEGRGVLVRVARSGSTRSVQG